MAADARANRDACTFQSHSNAESAAADSLSWASPELLPDAPKQRSLGNQLRRPLVVVLSYGVDIPACPAATAGTMTAEPVMFPIGLVRYVIGLKDTSSATV